jgi:hypothetical protein
MGGFPQRRAIAAPPPPSPPLCSAAAGKTTVLWTSCIFIKWEVLVILGKILANFSPFALNEVAFMQITTSSFFVLGRAVFSFYILQQANAF